MAIEGEGSIFELHRVPDGDREAWLEQRRRGIGGSDVAALMGISKYRTPLQLYMEKTGATSGQDISDKPAVMWGNILEPVVGDHYRKQHHDRTVRRVNAVCSSIKRPWAQASLDYEVRDPEHGWGVLEIKTAGLRVADDWADGVPVYYQTQVMHYLSVTGRAFADVAVLIGGSDYREYRLERDEEDIAAVNAAVDAFWERVQHRRMPPVTGTYGEVRDMADAFNDSTGDYMTRQVAPDALKAYLQAKDQADRAKKKLEETTASLTAMIGPCRGIECDAGRAIWVRGTSKTFDQKRFREENPEIYEKYQKETVRNGGIRWYPRKG